MAAMKVKLNDEILKPLTDEQLESLSRKELIVLARGEHALRMFLAGYVHELEEKVFEYEGRFFRIRAKMFGKSSERSPRRGRCREKTSSTGEKKPHKKLPSERYPNAEIIEKDVLCDNPPACKCCGHELKDSGDVRDLGVCHSPPAPPRYCPSTTLQIPLQRLPR